MPVLEAIGALNLVITMCLGLHHEVLTCMKAVEPRHPKEPLEVILRVAPSGAASAVVAHPLV